MIPYANAASFALLAALALPAIYLRWQGRGVRVWIAAASALMLVPQACLQWQTALSLALFALLQAGAIYGFQRVCRIAPPQSPGRRWGFRGALLLALAPLLACRLLPIFTKTFAFGFLGVSYVTFRSLDVLFGLNDGLIASLEAAQLFAFLFFFPPLSSGPIDRYRRFGKDWETANDRSRALPDIDEAVHHIFRGLLYKFLLAFLVKTYWLDPAEAQPGALGMVSYMYAYSAFLFFDFAGYSAFAVGASCLFGIRTPENFNKPFLARNIRDFWTRWHISLSTWFRDHVYMRFVLAAAKGKWFAGNMVAASCAGYLLTFGLMGLWHGLAINFLVYGLYHAALLIGYDLFKRWNQKAKLLGDGRFARGLGIAATAQAACFGFLIFSGHLYLGPGTAHPSVKAGLHANGPRALERQRLREARQRARGSLTVEPPLRSTAALRLA